MPAIRKSADLRNKYVEVYEELANRYKLYDAIHLALDQIKNGEIIPGPEMMKKIKKYA